MYMSVKTNCFVEVLKSFTLFEKEVIGKIGSGATTVDDFISNISNVAEYGCSSGCASEFIYTKDNTEFFVQNLGAVLDILDDIEYVYWMKKDEILNVDCMVWACVEDICRKFMNHYEELYEEKLGDE